jgi:vanadium chloroperoxidase
LAKFDAEGVDNVGFDFVSDEYDGRNEDPRTGLPRDLITRRHASLWQAIVENSVSRVYLGVHWEFDGVTVKGPDGKAAFGVPVTPKELGDIGGVWLGAQIANVLALKLGVSPTTINKSCM